MIVRQFSIVFALLSSLHAFAQQNQPSITCSATEQAVGEVSHQLWAAFRSRDVAAWDKLVEDLLTMAVRARRSRTFLPNSGNPKATSITIPTSSPKIFEWYLPVAWQL